MKIRIFSLGAAILLPALPVAAQVSAPENREETLARAERLAVKEAAPETLERFASVANPFASRAEELEEKDAGADAVTAEAVIAVSDEVILAEISELIRPTGVLKFGSETQLVIGERRVPVGQFLTIRYQGETYRVQLIKADPRGFMLRLNDEIISKRIR